MRAVWFILLAASTASILAQELPKPIPAREAVKTFKVADGLEIKLAACEPLVRQPVSISFDDCGRLWVLQYLQYPIPAGLKPVAVDEYLRTKYDKLPEPPPKGPKGNDRISVLEDTDGDGVMDRGHDFVGGLNLASGMALGFGGVFVVQPPYLLFYADRNGDTVADGDPQVLLTGFGMEDAHAFANSLTWGPDGWLYGVQGSTATANIRGVEFQQGAWRYHPRTKVFELFAEGGGNSWGLDFDRFGNLFAAGNTVEPLVHHVQGAYYVKGFGKHGPLHNPYAFGYFPPVEHHGYLGDSLTGGYVIYQGGAFPKQFDNACIAPNTRHSAVRWSTIEKKGTTFATRHGGDFITSTDPWFRPIDSLVGPDGALYVVDWYDVNISHSNPKNRAEWYVPSRNDGRIWRVSMQGSTRKAECDPPLGMRTGTELLGLLSHPNAWYQREALRILYQRRDLGKEVLENSTGRRPSVSMGSRDEPTALRAFFARYATLPDGQFNEFARNSLQSRHEYVRAWMVRILGDARDILPFQFTKMAEMARDDDSPIVRSQLACTAKRLVGVESVAIIAELIKHDEDARDPQIPLLIWWAIESKAIRNRGAILKLFESPDTWQRPLARDTVLGRLARRYIAEQNDAGYAACRFLMNHAPTPADIEILVAGMEQQLAGRSLPAPPEPLRAPLEKLLSQPAPSVATLSLGARLNLPQAAPLLAERLRDGSVPVPVRTAAIETLAEVRSPIAAREMIALLNTEKSDVLREAAINALARLGDPATGPLLFKLWSGLSPKLRERALDVLASRPAWTGQLLDAVDAKQIDARLVSTEQVRRMLLHADPQMQKRVTSRWGSVRTSTPREKQGRMLAVSQMLARGNGVAENGHRLFTKHCAVCHKLNNEGNLVGPDLNGADRKNLPVLLVNVVDPSAVIRPEFRAYNVALHDGRILTGLLADSNDQAVTVLDAKNQRTILRQTDIEEVKPSDVSLMPDNVLDGLSDNEIRDLFRYVRGE